jgi:hypothetical protein
VTSVGDFIREKLLLNTVIKNAVFDRVSPVYLPQHNGSGVAPDGISYYRRSTDITHAMNGSAGHGTGIWTTRVWTSDYDTGQSVADAVTSSLDGKRGDKTAWPEIRRVFQVDRRDVPVTPEFGEGNPPFLVELDFSIAFAEPIRTGT